MNAVLRCRARFARRVLIREAVIGSCLSSWEKVFPESRLPRNPLHHCTTADLVKLSCHCYSILFAVSPSSGSTLLSVINLVVFSATDEHFYDYSLCRIVVLCLAAHMTRIINKSN